MNKPYKIVNSNILPSPSLFPIRIPNAVGIKARYRNAKVYTQTAYSLQTPMNPLWPRAEKRWETRTDPLWWSAIAHKNIENHKTVRSWAARRLRIAFVESLKKRGWAADGTPMNTFRQQKSLYGTLQMSPEDGSIKVGFEQILKETDFIVAEIIRKQGREPYCESKEAVQASKRKSSW